MYQRSRTSWTKHIDFMILDLVCLVLSYLAAYEIRKLLGGLQTDLADYWNLGIVVLFLEIIAALLTNNHSRILRRDTFSEIIHVIILSLVTFLVSTFYIFTIRHSEEFSRLMLYTAFAMFMILDSIARIIMKKIVIRRLKKRAMANDTGKAVFIVTDRSHASMMLEEIHGDYFHNYSIKGITLTDAAEESCCLGGDGNAESRCAVNSEDNEDQSCFDGRPEKEVFNGIDMIAGLDEAADYICRDWIDEVFIFVPDGAAKLKEFNRECREMGVTIHSVMDISTVNENSIFMEKLADHAVLTTAFSFIDNYQAIIKRLADILGGIVGSIIAVLIGIVIGPIIKIKSPGPVIFKQRRIGKNGKQFYVLKFRSMHIDAEEKKASLMADNRVSDGMMFKMDFDPRIIGNTILPDGTKKTGIGEFIRKTSLDEFPQFFNVLKGEMSLVGTRPPTVDEWEKYEYHHRARLAVKPGITGLWQVSGRSEITDFEEVVRLDTKYITSFRLSLDVKILFKTIIVLIKRKGAM